MHSIINIIYIPHSRLIINFHLLWCFSLFGSLNKLNLCKRTSILMHLDMNKETDVVMFGFVALKSTARYVLIYYISLKILLRYTKNDILVHYSH